MSSTLAIPPWHESALERLRAGLASDRITHSIIVGGPPGWGQTALACRLAEALLGEPAGRVFDEFAHADFRWLKRGLNKTGTKLSEVINVDQIREIQTFLNSVTGVDRRKVLIIDEAHRLNKSAANALLKTLEEPPSGTHILLVSESSSRLLPTVRSRCQNWPAVPSQPEVARQWLIEQGVDTKQADALLFEYGGAPEPALLAAQQDESPLEPVLAALRRGSTIASVADALKDEALDRLTARWGRYVVASLAGQGPFASLSAASLLEFDDELRATRRHVLTNNAPNSRLILERLCLLWRQIPAL